jgi:hypothetical protein
MTKGVLLAVICYCLATIATAILFLASPREYPQSVGRFGPREKVQSEIQVDIKAINKRAMLTKWGFAILFAGTILQLLGTILSARGG